MTGVGWIRNPYDEDKHWDWIQCCPYNYNDAQTSRVGTLTNGQAAASQQSVAEGESTQTMVLTPVQQQLVQHRQLASTASQLRYQAGGGARRPALDEQQQPMQQSASTDSGGAAAQQASADALRALLLQPLPSSTFSTTTAAPSTVSVQSAAAASSTSKQRRSFSGNSFKLGSLPTSYSFMTALTADVP